MNRTSFSSIRSNVGARLLSATKVPLGWPSIKTLVPHRIRRKLRSTRSRLRSRQSPTSSITALQTSLSPADTINSLRSHQWSFYDGQYLLLAVVAIFSLCVMETPSPMTKTLIATLLMTSLVFPISRQFFLPFLPIATWLFYLYACQ